MVLPPPLGFEVVFAAGDELAVGEDVAVGVTVAGGGTAAQNGRVMTLVSSVTAPLRASRRPWIVAPVVAEMEVRASTVPTKVEFVPRVAELPTCQ
jgi:hypothetical protein